MFKLHVSFQPSRLNEICDQDSDVYSDDHFGSHRFGNGLYWGVAEGGKGGGSSEF